MNNYRIIKDYINYYFRANTKYSVHSPFVFEFITKVLKRKTLKTGQIGNIENLRKQLLSSKEEINVLDFGAGSETTQTKIISVSKILKNSAKNKKYAALLYRIISYYKLQNILELGTSAGISSMYFASAFPEVNVITIEGCPETSRLAKENLKNLNYKNIKQITGNIDHVLPEIIRQEKKLDFVFFDGNHREEATLRYFEQCLPAINNESVFVFDDINWSEGMKNAWNKIKKHPSVKISIDLFFLGIVFFRKELSKEDFVIRF